MTSHAWAPSEGAGARQIAHLPHKVRPRRRPRSLRKIARDRRRQAATSAPGLPQAKGRTIAQNKRAAEAAELKQIHATHVEVWNRSDFCECCGDDEAATFLRSPIATHDMHEDPSRAETAGKPPDERFTPAICGRVCSFCHDDLQQHRVAIVFHDPVRRFLGDFDVIDRVTGRMLRQMRRALRSRVFPTNQEDTDR